MLSENLLLVSIPRALMWQPAGYVENEQRLWNPVTDASQTPEAGAELTILVRGSAWLV